METLLLIGAVAVVLLVAIAEVLHRLIIRHKARRIRPRQSDDQSSSDWRAGLR